MPRTNLTGRIFGYLRVLHLSRRQVPKHTYWRVECQNCGKRKDVRADSLLDGSIVSCGCYQRQVASRHGIHHKSGSRFGRLTIISEVSPGKYRCRCDCGRSCIIKGKHLRNGETSSCGCYFDEVRKTCCLRHGQCRTRKHGGHTGTYSAYHRQKSWCRNPRDRQYRRYGARGIELRFDSFEEFYREVGDKPGENYSLIRLDPDGHFEAGNLEWVFTPRKHRKH